MDQLNEASTSDADQRYIDTVYRVRRRVAVAKRQKPNGYDSAVLQAKVEYIETNLRQLSIKSDEKVENVKHKRKADEVEYVPIKFRRSEEPDLGKISRSLRRQVGKTIKKIDSVLEGFEDETCKMEVDNVSDSFFEAMEVDTLINEIGDFIKENKAQTRLTRSCLRRSRDRTAKRKKKTKRGVKFNVMTEVKYFSQDVGEEYCPCMIVP